VERLEVNIAHQLFRHIRRVVIAPAVGCTVSGKMFYAGQHTVWSYPRTLESAHLRATHGGAEVWILTCAFHDAAPTGIAGNIDHRREGPLNAGRTRILR
jgi:hypothetical protein